MKILHLTHKPPFPEIDGGSSAIRMMLETMMGEGHEVCTLTVSTKKHTAQIQNELSAKIHAITVDTSHHFLKFLDCFLTGKSYFLQRFYNLQFDKKIRALQQEHNFEAVVFDGLQLYPYLNTVESFQHVRRIYRSHNIEYQLFYERGSTAKSFFKKWFYSLESTRIKKSEMNMIQRVDAVACISSTDADMTNSLVPDTTCHIVSPFVENKTIAPVQRNSDELTIGFLGALDWEPNVLGLNWFINEVWPKLPGSGGCLLHIAGKSSEKFTLTSPSENIKVLGEVKDADRFLSSLDVMIVPLFQGSGIRMKILRAMSHEIAVIASSKALDGISATPDKHILVADKPENFVHAIQSFIANRERVKKIGQEAGNYVRDQFSLQHSMQQFHTLLQHT